jgi:hypothetical protein
VLASIVAAIKEQQPDWEVRASLHPRLSAYRSKGGKEGRMGGWEDGRMEEGRRARGVHFAVEREAVP